MGVSHLLSLLKEIKGGICPVNVKEEIKQSGRNQPLVVIDLLTLVSSLSGAAGDHIYGCRNQFAFTKAVKFCEKMKNLGARLVFFIDGKVQKEKYESWLTRQDYVYEQSLPLLDVAERRRCKVRGNVIKQSFISALVAAARTKGQLYTTYDFECDKEVAAFCTKNDAFALITNDSDYLMYEGNWRIWGSDKFSITSMCTEEWKKEVLRQALGLQWKQMPFFAVIAGNDYFQHKPEGMDLYAVAETVRNLDLRLGETRITTGLCKKLFGKRKKKFKQAFKNGVALYDLNYSVQTPFVPAYMRTYPNSAICILLGIPGAIRLPCLDLRERRYSQIALQLYRRQLGMLLQSNNNNNQPLSIFMKRNHDTPYRRVQVWPIYPPYTVPSLPYLYSSDIDSYLKLYHIRKKLLCWMVSEKLNSDEIGLLPSTYLVDVLTLYFLVDNKIIDIHEADIILLVIHHYMQNWIPDILHRSYPRKSNLRISLCYVLFYNHLYFCAETVGLIQPLESTFFCKFDAVYFHKIVENSLYNRKNIQSFLKPIAHLRIYAKGNRASRRNDSFTV